ncbi:methionine ABC transporter permease, partial [Klebsiella pneumoniae]
IPSLLLPAYGETWLMVAIVMLFVVTLGGLVGVVLFNATPRGLFPGVCTGGGVGGGGWGCKIIASAQLSEAMPALVAAVTLNLVSMIEYSAIAGTIGAGGIGYLAVVYGYQRFDNHIMIATIVALIATIQLIQFLGDRLVNRLRHTQGNLV